MEERDENPYCGCAATVDSPYEIIEERELIPGIVRLIRPLPSPLIELTSIDVILVFPLTSRVYQ